MSSDSLSVMSHRERIAAALRGQPVDRPPVSFWQHFPGRDHTTELLAAATVAFQDKYDLDLVKLMPTGMYSVQDYGVTVRPSQDDIGTTRFVSGPISEPGDWDNLPRVSPEDGVLAQQVAVVRNIRAALGADTPIIQTVFSPLTVAAKLAGGSIDPRFFANEPVLRRALERIAADVIAFGLACLQAGADGFFYAVQPVDQSSEAGTLYEQWGVPYDLAVLEALRSASRILMLHLHGANPPFELVDRYPVDAVNWEDRETFPSLAEALQRTDRCLVAGVSRFLVENTPADVVKQVREAIAVTGGRRLIVAPGCVVPVNVAERILQALRQAVQQ